MNLNIIFPLINIIAIVLIVTGFICYKKNRIELGISLMVYGSAMVLLPCIAVVFL